MPETSLDLQRAIATARPERLPKPEFYLLKVVGGLIGLGAARLEIALQRDLVEVTAHGAILPVGQSISETLKVGIFDGSSPARDLALGLLAAAAAEKLPLEWHFPLRETGSLGPEGLTLSEPGSNPQNATVRIHRRQQAKKGGFFARWLGGGSGTAEEHQLLSNRLLFSPAEIWLDGRRLDEPVLAAGKEPYLTAEKQSYKHLSERVVQRQGKAHLRVPGYESRSAELVLHCNGMDTFKVGPQVGTLLWSAVDPEGHLMKRAEVDRPFRAFATLVLPAKVEGSGTLFLVHRGVTLGGMEVELGFPGATAVVSAEGLSLDDSQFGVEQDDAFEQLLADLRVHVKAMQEQVKVQLARLAPDFQAHLEPHL